MKKRKGIRFELFSLGLTTCLYVVFYSRIESKPNHAGFWFIILLGISIGVALTRFFQWLQTKKPDN
jgi:hypothetical protein